MNPTKLLGQIIRRQIEALAEMLTEAEVAGDITPNDAAALIQTAKTQFELLCGRWPRGSEDRDGKAPKNSEAELMKLVAAVIGPEGMEEGGKLWRCCIRGENGHPPRPDRVRRAMEIARSELAEGKEITKSVTKFAWSIYKNLRD